MTSTHDFLMYHSYCGVFVNDLCFWSNLEKVVKSINKEFIPKFNHLFQHYAFHRAFFIYERCRDDQYYNFISTQNTILTSLATAALKKRNISTDKKSKDNLQFLEKGMRASYEDLEMILQSFIDFLLETITPIIYNEK